MRSNQNTSGMPGINTLEWLHKHHFSNTSLVAREPDGSSPVWQAQDVSWLLRSGRDYLSVGKEWGCQAPEVLWAVRSARKNDAIANKFTWPSSVSGGQAGECLSVRQWPPAFSPEILGGKRKMLTGLCWALSEVILLFYLWPFSSWEGFSFMQEQHLLTESSLGMNCLQGGLDAVIVCPIPQEPPWDKSRGKIKNQRCHSNQAIERYIHTHICVCLCMFTMKLAKGLHLYPKPYFNVTTALTYLWRGGN